MTTKWPRVRNPSQPPEPPQEPCYRPISYTWQLMQCKRLHLPFVRMVGIKIPTTIHVLKHRCPHKVIRTDGDGNCLFRCFSFALTGSDSYHDVVRAIIVDHIARSGKTFSAFFPESFEDDPAKYLSTTEMALPGTWGSDVEILAAAHLLKTRIYVYTLHGNNWQWVEHNLDLTSPESRMHRESIYLMHTSLIHYDLVDEVEPRQHVSRKDRSAYDLKSRDKYIAKHKPTECSGVNDNNYIKQKTSAQSLNRSNNAPSKMIFSLSSDEIAFARSLEARKKSGTQKLRRGRYMSTDN